VARCSKCGAKASFMMNMCDSCIAASKPGAVLDNSERGVSSEGNELFPISCPHCTNVIPVGARVCGVCYAVKVVRSPQSAGCLVHLSLLVAAFLALIGAIIYFENELKIGPAVTGLFLLAFVCAVVGILIEKVGGKETVWVRRE
jgi:hypothetical protein